MTEPALSTAGAWERPSVPRPGSSLAAVTEARAAHVRRAVESVGRALAGRESTAYAWSALLANRWRFEPVSSAGILARRAAWALVSMRIVGRSVGALPAGASLRDGEIWFVGETNTPEPLSDAVSEFTDREVVHALESFTYDEDLRDLLPYVLDAHGPGSRASVMKDPTTRKARRAKRAAGVFYTPSDVAEFIARESLDALGETPERASILDPACGSGVFLKAVLDLARTRTPNLNRSDFVERRLHGIDVDPLAVEAACFVLLHECLRASPGRRAGSPWSLWHRIRCNLCVADALTFQLAAPARDRSSALSGLRKRLDDSYVAPAPDRPETRTATTLFSESPSLGDVFPALSAGADVVIGNPPYAAIGPRRDAAALERRFESLSARTAAGSDLFPVFVEMMWRFARPDRSASGMVVPLSLACSRRSQLQAVRRAISASGGRWRFAFFDREPHALFGEDVKTRNTIALRRKCSSDAGQAVATIETGPLRKWTSRQRSRLFDAIDFTPLGDGAISITAGIPKLDGPEPARVFGRLARRTSRMREMCLSVGSCLPEDAVRGRGGAHVFVGGTAYNFLNVFRPHRSLPKPRAPWSASTVLELGFAGEDAAARGFALLCSRVTYWLWRVTEDGFHVGRSFLTGLPFNDGIFSAAERVALTGLGSELWDRVQHQQVVSVNGGRQTVAYKPSAGDDLRDRIDALLLAALGAAPSFIDYLRAFTRGTVRVDERGETPQPSFAFADRERRCRR